MGDSDSCHLARLAGHSALVIVRHTPVVGDKHRDLRRAAATTVVVCGLELVMLRRLQRLQLAQPTRDALLKEKQDMIANYHRGGAAANMLVQRLWGRGAGIAGQRMSGC